MHFDGVFIKIFAAFFFYPSQCLLIFFLIVNTFGHAANNFNLVNGFHTHSEILFKEFRRNNTSADSHCDRADLKIRFSAHRCDCYCRSCKTQYLFLNVIGNGRIVCVLNFVSVNSESGQTFLTMSCKNGRKIHRTRSFRAVESPNRFNGHRIHIHSFRTVTPTRRNRKSDVNVVLFEFICTCSGFCNSAYRSVGNNDFDRFAV